MLTHKKDTRYVILDRDGTVIVERHYLSDPEQVELLPGAAEGLRRFRAMGFGLILITNQSGIGRGFFDTERLASIHQKLRDILDAEGIALDGLYYCPHRPDEHCSCRKPAPGMLHQAAQELGFEPDTCVVIGDKACDIELGQQVGATTVLVRTGYGERAAEDASLHPDYVVDNLDMASSVLETHFAHEPQH